MYLDFQFALGTIEFIKLHLYQYYNLYEKKYKLFLLFNNYRFTVEYRINLQWPNITYFCFESFDFLIIKEVVFTLNTNHFYFISRKNEW